LFSALFDCLKQEKRMAKAGRTAGIEPRCRKIAEQMGYELVEIAMDREPAGMMLRFYIDRPEGISLDDCEAYHKAVRALADEIDYDYMEVSSPGIDRPLKTERDFERNLGSEIEVHLFRPLEGSKRWTGILAGLEGTDILLETDGENPQHAGVINAFAAHLLRGEPTVADAEDGLRALELSNAIHLSGWTGERVEIPVSCEAFNRELDKRIAKSVPRTGGDITYDTDHSRGGSRNN
jgi:ribosome maturation factor RimP